MDNVLFFEFVKIRMVKLIQVPYEIDLSQKLSAMIVEINYDSGSKSGTIRSNEIC